MALSAQKAQRDAEKLVEKAGLEQQRETRRAARAQKVAERESREEAELREFIERAEAHRWNTRARLCDVAVSKMRAIVRPLAVRRYVARERARLARYRAVACRLMQQSARRHNAVECARKARESIGARALLQLRW